MTGIVLCERMHQRLVTALILCSASIASLSAAETRRDREVNANGLGKVEAYEPIYAIVEPHHRVTEGDDAYTNIKFQLSLAYPMVEFGDAHGDDPRKDGFFLSYTQTSFWDMHAESKPFYDTSYKPEGWFRLGCKPLLGTSSNSIEFGFAHESNGRDGEASRTINRWFLRTNARWELGPDWYVLAHPRFSAYRNDVDNPLMSEYRGYVDLLVDVGQENGAKLALLGRIGDTGEYGCLQADLSWPLNRTWPLYKWFSDFNGYVYFQTFIGYSETLLDYTARADIPRFGIGYALVR